MSTFGADRSQDAVVGVDEVFEGEGAKVRADGGNEFRKNQRGRQQWETQRKMFEVV